MSGSASRVPLPEVADLIAIGRPLPFKVLDAVGRLLLNAGHVVQDERQLELLLERGACVEHADAEAVRAARAQLAGVATAPPKATRTLSWFDRWERRVWTLDGLIKALGRDTGLAAELVEFADEQTALVERHPDAALFLCVRQDDRRFALYPLTHALHCATVALLTARQLGWPAGRRRTVVRAALTMNASVTELQARMAEQSDPPTKRQLEQIRGHPEASVALLRASGVTDEDWLTAVAEHHERADGSGYPRGTKEVGETARVLRAADQFSAKLSPRALRSAVLPQVAARQLFQEDAGGPVAGALIKAVGIYPPGDFVRLKNGEGGVVVQRAGAGKAPVVAVLVSASGKPVGGAPRRDTAQAEFGIAGPWTERAGQARLLPEVVFGLLEP
jgi:hypothetical protein